MKPHRPTVRAPVEAYQMCYINNITQIYSAEQKISHVNLNFVLKLEN